MATHDYKAIVSEALNGSHKMAEAYRAFWNYSFGNQYLAMQQLSTPEPINTFKGWQKLGRFVKKGEKAIALIMPVNKEIEDTTGEIVQRRFFVSKNFWFGLSQTEGAEYVAPAIPEFSLEDCLAELGISRAPFECVNGNAQGYALPDLKRIAINPLAFDPTKTTFHEIAHCLLHSGPTLIDDSALSCDVREVEAELTAYIVKSALGLLSGLEYSRGYLRNWIEDTTCEKVRFAQVFNVVDRILKAGRSSQEEFKALEAA